MPNGPKQSMHTATPQAVPDTDDSTYLQKAGKTKIHNLIQRILINT